MVRFAPQQEAAPRIGASPGIDMSRPASAVLTPPWWAPQSLITKALEAKLVLEKMVEGVRVGAGVAIVILVVSAHDCTGARANDVGKWHGVELVCSLPRG